MKLEKIIDILGKVLDCNYIVRRVQEPHSTFKGFVTYTIELYDKKDKPILILGVSRVIAPLKKDKEIELLEEEFIKTTFNYVL